MTEHYKSKIRWFLRLVLDYGYMVEAPGLPGRYRCVICALVVAYGTRRYRQYPRPPYRRNTYTVAQLAKAVRIKLVSETRRPACPLCGADRTLASQFVNAYYAKVEWDHRREVRKLRPDENYEKSLERTVTRRFRPRVASLVRPLFTGSK